MNKIKMKIWGRSFNLRVIYECYGHQEVTEFQESLIKSFEKSVGLVDAVLPKVKQYCLEDENLNGVWEIDNIFKYVMPNSIYVKRDEKEGVIALLCDYKFDIEHGIAIVFSNGRFKEIAGQGNL